MSHKKQQCFLAGKSDELEITDAKGTLLIGRDGKRYIDFTMGWCVGNLGWSQEHIRSAIREFEGPAYVYPSYSYSPWEELAALLVKLAPRNLKNVYRATGGTEAVDIALQIAMAYTRRGKFLSIEGCYHGNSIATGSIADYSRDTYPNILANCHKINPPLNADKLAQVETQLKHRDVAAFIMEPVICNLGVLVPEPEFMAGLQKLCERYGTLLIIDEVATGFGRTGKLFACEHFDLRPDLLCLAKAITGGYAPMGAVLVTKEIADEVDEEYYSTYGWHPLSVAAALANLRHWQEHKSEIFAHATEISALIEERLAIIDFQHDREISAKGMAFAVDVGDSDYAEDLKQRCQDAGLLLTTQKGKLVFFPALTVEHKTALAALDILDQCVQDASLPQRRTASRR